MHHLTSSQLRHIAELKEKIETLEAEVAGIISVGGKPHATVQAPEPVQPANPGKRKMSPAHKAAIRAAQALRWAKYNAAKAKAAPKAAKKGGMSAEGKARIIAAQKLRWAKVKAAKAEAPGKAEGKKRQMSAAGRAAIAAAARARWAKYNAAKK